MDYAELEQARLRRKAREVVYRGCLFERAYRHLQKCFKEPGSSNPWSIVHYPERWGGKYVDGLVLVQTGRYSCVFFY